MSIEERLGSVEKQVTGLRGEVGGLRDEVGGLRDEVGGLRDEVGGLRDEVGGLRAEVQKLRVLEEANAASIRLIAETHGAKLDQLAQDLKPLAEMRDFVRLVADDHERRISVLEERGG